LWRPYDRRADELQQRLAQATSTAADILHGLRVVKGFGGEATARRWFARDTAALQSSAVALSRLSGAWGAAAASLPAVFLAVVVWVGGHLALDGTLGPGQLVSFTGLAVFLAVPLSTFAEVGDVWASGLAGARRITTVLEAPHPVDDPPGGRSPRTGAVDLRGVRAGTLRGLDLAVADGTLVGVVCADAGDARSLTDVLARRVDPDAGTVSVGDVDIRTVPLAARAGHVLVDDGHEPWLADATLRENVALGDPTAPEARVLEALRAAGADELVARPDALGTAVGERGLGLSGGQRQRVAVARAVASDRPVLVLHDPTSALDTVTEARLAHRLEAARRGRTTILLTNRPPLLALCDHVALVVGGRCVATGDHATLLADDARYHALVIGDVEDGA
jgi:putative ABC transport system ATP-binding protein